MARVVRRRRKAEAQQTATPIDPNGIAAWTRRFLTWMGTQNYTARTIATREFALKRFIAWCDGRSLYRPEEVTKPILER